MSNPESATSVKAPWHLWVVGALALLWNSFGAFDYTMTETRNVDYLKGFTAEQLAYFQGFPKWVVGAWALSVWGGVAGSVAMLFRSRWAVPVFALSLLTMLPTFFHNYVLSNGFAIMGGLGALVFTAVIVLVGVGLLAYARGATRQGVLR